jgi:hypothetical protein
MEKALYNDENIVNYQGMVMKFGAIKGWIGMSEIRYSDIRPATYDEIVAYCRINDNA